MLVFITLRGVVFAFRVTTRRYSIIAVSAKKRIGSRRLVVVYLHPSTSAPALSSMNPIASSGEKKRDMRTPSQRR